MGWDSIAININRSIKEFESEDCIERWINEIDRHNLVGRDINFELTESILAPDQKNSLEKLARLQANGSKISLDDFGTGYSSLSYLRSFPIDELKIDRGFIMDMHQDKGDQTLVRSIIAMSRALGIKTVAEGIETNDHFNLLFDMHCDLGQGYLISKPLAPEMLTNFLEDSG